MTSIFDALTDYRDGVDAAIQVAQESAITLANLANAPRTVPFWVSPNPFEDVAFPRADLEREFTASSPTGDPSGSALGATWNSSAASNYNSHTHSFTAGLVDPTISIGAGTLALITVRTIQDRIYNTIGFVTNGASPPATVYAGLYTVDAVTGTMSLFYDFGNISASIAVGVGLTDTRVNTTSDIIATAGDLWAVGLLPIGAAMTVASIRKATINTVSGVYPRFATATLGSQTVLPSSVSDASQADATERLWACVGQAIAPDTSPITLVETFNVADTSAWSPASWNKFNGSNTSVGINSGRAYEANPTAFVSVNYMSSRLHKTQLHTDDHAAEITIGSGWDSGHYGEVTDRAYVRMRANGTTGVCMHVDFDGSNARVRIATVTNMTSIGTVRATSSGALPAVVGDRFRIEAAGNVFTCYRNDAVIASATWTDSGAVTSTGSNFRSVGFGTGAAGNVFGSADHAAFIDYFTGYDLT